MSRTRSPSYPSIPLSQAVDLVSKIHRSCRSNVISRETAVQEMGYSGLTGRSMKVLAALLQFGLLEKTGKGDVKVTQRSVDILHGIDPGDKDEAMLEAAMSPQLFRDIHERFPDGIPSENAIRSFLIKEDFMDAAIGPAISAFLQTYRTVEHIRANDSHGLDASEVPDSPEQELTPEPRTMNAPAQIAPSPQRLDAIASELAARPLNTINMNIIGDYVELSAKLNYRGLAALEKKIANLKLLMAPDEEEESAGGKLPDIL